MTVLDGCQLHELSMEAVADAAGVGKPVLYTVFRTRGELVAALLRREHHRGIDQVRAAMPDDLTVLGPTGAYAATISAFLQVVLENPTRWRLILTMPDSAPREYRDALRASRSSILAQAEELAKAGIALIPAHGAAGSSAVGSHDAVVRRDARPTGGQRPRHVSARASGGVRPNRDVAARLELRPKYRTRVIPAAALGISQNTTPAAGRRVHRGADGVAGGDHLAPPATTHLIGELAQHDRTLVAVGDRAVAQHASRGHLVPGDDGIQKLFDTSPRTSCRAAAGPADTLRYHRDPGCAAVHGPAAATAAVTSRRGAASGPSSSAVPSVRAVAQLPSPHWTLEGRSADASARRA